MKLDQTDKKIIQLLGADARMSNNQMAKVIGVTEGTVRNRIQKLIKNKVIKVSSSDIVNARSPAIIKDNLILGSNTYQKA